jgi:isopenicillin N synthase-like dioxygenase
MGFVSIHPPLRKRGSLTRRQISESEQKAIFEAMRSFFALDHEKKMNAHMHKNAAMRGYEPIMETQLDPTTKGDIKEAFTMGDCVHELEQDYRGWTGKEPPAHIKKPQNIWPESAPWLRASMYQYYSVVQPLAMKLMRLFALALQDDESAFDDYFKFPITGVRALHYPPMPPDSGANANGLGAHADFSWLTLVLQDSIGGLEVLNKEGVWIDAPPKPGTFVCNVGQFLERHTNGGFPATVHRVRNKTGERRYSIPFFLTPDPGAKLRILDECLEVGQEEPKRIDVGDLYIRRILPARKKHPTSVRYIETPEEEWRYDFLYGE